MNTPIYILLLSLYFLTNSHAKHYVDFTLSQYSRQNTISTIDRQNNQFHPSSKNPSNFQFPKICELQNQLGTQDSEFQAQSYKGADDHLEFLSQKMLQFLKTSEQIRRTKQNLKQLSVYVTKNKNQGNSSQFNSQIADLSLMENNLNQIKEQITNYTNELERLSSNEHPNQYDIQFNLSALSYQLDSYNSKLSQLRLEKYRAEEATKRENQLNYTAFFDNLSIKFRQQSGLIGQLGEILAKFNDVAYLRNKIASLSSKIQALNLYIEEKEKCQIQKTRNRGRGSNPEIKQLMITLRQKKKDFGNEPNKYCQGVAKKLESQIKRLLKVENWTYSCAEGRQSLLNERQLQTLRLTQAKKQLEDIENQGFEQYYKDYNRTKDDIKDSFERMKGFTLNQYHHNVEEIDYLIAETQREIQSVSSELKGLNNISSSENQNNNRQLVDDLVGKLKIAKAKYCKDYESYDRKAHILWNKIREFEEKERFSTKMRSFYMEESQKLSELQQVFKNEGNQIINYLQKHHEINQ